METCIAYNQKSHFQLHMENMLNCVSNASCIGEDITSSMATSVTVDSATAVTPTNITTANEKNSSFPGLARKSVEDSAPVLSHSNYFSSQSPEPSSGMSPQYLRHPNFRFGTKSPIMHSDKTHLHDLLQVTFPTMETYWSNFYQRRSDLGSSLTKPCTSETYQQTSSVWHSTTSTVSNEWDSILSLNRFTELNTPNRNLADLSSLMVPPNLPRTDSNHYTKFSEVGNSSINSCLSVEKYGMKNDNLPESRPQNDYQNQMNLSCQTNHCRDMSEVLSLSIQTPHKPTDLTVYQISRNNCEQSDVFYNTEKSLVPTQTTTYFDSKCHLDPTHPDNSLASSPHKNKGHIKKPLNAFMLFMKEKRTEVMAECTLKESAVINQILGRKWHALTREEQSKYYEQARQEKEVHQRLYPGWSARDNYACQARRKKRRTPKTDLFLLNKNRQDSNSKQPDDKFMLFRSNKSVDMQSHAVYGEEHLTQWSSNSKINYQSPMNISQSWKRNNLLNYDVLRERDATANASPFSEPAHSYLSNPCSAGIFSVSSKVRESIDELPRNLCSHIEGDTDKFAKGQFGSEKDGYYPGHPTSFSTYSATKVHKPWTLEDTNPPPSHHGSHRGWLDQKTNHPNDSCLCYSPYSTGSNFMGLESDNSKSMIVNPEWSNPLLFRNTKHPVPDLLQSTCHSGFSSKQLGDLGSLGDGASSEDFERRICVNNSSENYSNHVAATVAVAAAAAYALKTNCWPNTGYDLSQPNPRSLDYLGSKQTDSYSPRSESTPESLHLQSIGDELQ